MTKIYATAPRHDYVCDPAAAVCTDCLIWHANGDGPADMGYDDYCAYVTKVNRTMGELTLTIGWGREQHECDADAEECECERDTFSRRQCASCGTTLAGERHGVTVWADGRDAYAANVRAGQYLIWADGDYYADTTPVRKVTTDAGWVWVTTDARTYRLCPSELVAVA